MAWSPDLASASPKDKENALGLFFYGEAPNSPFTDTSVYRLQKDSGLLMQTVPAGAAAPVAGGTFAETEHVEKDLFAATVLPLDPDSDYWFWDFLQGGTPPTATRRSRSTRQASPAPAVARSPSPCRARRRAASPVSTAPRWR